MYTTQYGFLRVGPLYEIYPGERRSLEIVDISLITGTV